MPAVRQGNNFTYHMNAKEMMMWDLDAKNTKQIKVLEEQTGVNLACAADGVLAGGSNNCLQISTQLLVLARCLVPRNVYLFSIGLR